VIAFSQDDEVAADNVDAGDAFLHAVADHERTRAGQIAQAFEQALSGGFLNDGDQNRSAGKNAEHDSFFEIAEHEIDNGAVPVVCLTKIFHQAAESGIISDAHRIADPAQ
jgi:hypothetical protein